MSTLLLNTLTGKTSAGSIVVTGEGGSTTTNLQNGIVKAWTYFDGSAGSLSGADSLNESSVTDHATGDYTFTITNAMGNTNYASLSNPMCEDNHGRGPICLGLRVDGSNNASTNTTTARRFECLFGGDQSTSGGAQDTKNATVVFIGDLA